MEAKEDKMKTYICVISIIGAKPDFTHSYLWPAEAVGLYLAGDGGGVGSGGLGGPRGPGRGCGPGVGGLGGWGIAVSLATIDFIRYVCSG